MKKTAADTLRHYRGYIDRGMSFEQQKNSQNSIAEQLYYFEIGLQEHQKRKKEWDILLCNKNYHSFDFSAIELPPNFPMLGSGTFFHEYDFSGQLLQPPGKYLHKYDLLAFNMARSPNALWLVFGWMKSEPSGARFVESLAALKSDDLHEAVMRFCWETTDNLFINPIWWDSKNESDKETLIRFGQASLPGERTRDALVPNGADAFRI